MAQVELKTIFLTFAATQASNRFKPLATLFRKYLDGLVIDSPTRACSQYTNSVPDGSDTEGVNGFGLSYFRLSENNTNLPRVVSVSGLDDNVKIGFSIPLDPLSATDPSNYILTNVYGPVVVFNAALEADGQTVDLTTGGEGPFLVHVWGFNASNEFWRLPLLAEHE